MESKCLFMVVLVVQAPETTSRSLTVKLPGSDGVNLLSSLTTYCLCNDSPEAVHFEFARKEHRDQSHTPFLAAVTYDRRSQPQIVHLLSRYLSVQIIRWRRSRAVSTEL